MTTKNTYVILKGGKRSVIWLSQEKCLLPKSDNLILIPLTHMVQGANRPLHTVSDPLNNT